MKNKSLHVPDPASLCKVEELCTWEHPYQAMTNYDILFADAMREIMAWHQDRSNLYKNVLQKNKFSLSKWDGDLAEIPYLVADFFKLHEVKSIPDHEVAVHLTSSGTAGQKSQIFFDKWSLGCAQRMIDFIFSENRWVDERLTNYLLYTYETEEGAKLGTAYTDNFLTKYAPIQKVFYALRWNGKGGNEFDLYGCIRMLEDFAQEGKPVRIFGFPAFLYFTLQRMQDLKRSSLKLHPDSLVFLGGGWKGHADQAIKKEDLYRMIETQLGIPNVRLRDGYGSVEHCIPYIECRNHHFHAPVYSKILIRDLRTLKPLGYEKKGFLNFVSPYITSVPAHSVMMGDLAILRPGRECGCGIRTDWFEILGRAGVSKNKSCAVAATELLRSFG